MAPYDFPVVPALSGSHKVQSPSSKFCETNAISELHNITLAEWLTHILIDFWNGCSIITFQ